MKIEIFKQITSKESTYVIRNFIEDDIKLIANYFDRSNFGFLDAIGFNTKKIPRTERLIDNYRQALHVPPPEKANSQLFMAEVNGTAIGYLLATDIHYGEYCFSHAHWIHTGQRNVGHSTVLFLPFLDLILTRFKLTRAYYETLAGNKAGNRTLQKFNPDFITLEKEESLVNRKGIFNRYTFTREHIEKAKTLKNPPFDPPQNLQGLSV